MDIAEKRNVLLLKPFIYLNIFQLIVQKKKKGSEFLNENDVCFSVLVEYL